MTNSYLLRLLTEMIQTRRYKLKLNSIEKIEELLQELYNEADKVIIEAQEQINKLTNSVNLNDEIMEAKTKYAKAINDFINSKDKSIGRKLEIAKLMTEIHKFNGNITNVVNNSNNIGDWESIKETLYEKEEASDTKGKIEGYGIKTK